MFNKATYCIDLLTYKWYGFWEELGQVLTPVVGNGNLFVPEVAIVLKHVWQIGCDVQDVLYIVLAQHV